MSILTIPVHKAQRDEAERHLTEAVIAARSQGHSWAKIGKALGVTTQAAHQKYRWLVKVAEREQSA